MGNIKFVLDDITNMKVDCIVNSANNHLQPGGGVCGAIFKAAGYENLKKACDIKGYCETGKAISTSGFALCSRIIHAVGPVYKDGKHNEAQLLKDTYNSVLEIARTSMFSSIAFPLISSGSYGFPIEEAISIALNTCADFLNKGNNIFIYFVTTNEKTYALGNKILEGIKIYTPDELLLHLDPQILRDNINYFAKYDSVKWEGGKCENGTISFAYPIYPSGMRLIELLNGVGGFDYDYNFHMKMMEDRKISEMGILHIRTFLTYVIRGEKFCDGHIAEHMKDRSILKACLRLEDLREKILEYERENNYKKYSIEYIKSLKDIYGEHSVYYDHALRRWHACIPLQKENCLYLTVFLDHDGKLNKYSLDVNIDHDIHYEFDDEKHLRKQIYLKDDENKYLHEILTRYEPHVLLNLLKSYIIRTYSF